MCIILYKISRPAEVCNYTLIHLLSKYYWALTMCQVLEPQTPAHFNSAGAPPQ